MTEKPRETQAESHVVEFKEKVNNSSLMKHRVNDCSPEILPPVEVAMQGMSGEPNVSRVT